MATIEVKDGVLKEEKPGTEPISIALDTLPEDLQEQIKEYEAERESLGDVIAEKSHMLERKAKEIVDELEDEEEITYNLDPWIKDEEKQKHKIIELELKEDWDKKKKEAKAESKDEDEPADKAEPEDSEDEPETMPLPKYFQDLYEEFADLQ